MELNPDIANFHALTAFPGTYLHDNLEQYGRGTDDLTKYTYQGASFVPYTMTQQQIHELRQLAFKRFYSRPKFLINRALQIRSWNDCVAAYKGVKCLFWIWRDKKIFSEDENSYVATQQ